MLGAFTVLLVFQLIGEVLVLVSGLPVPGPVVGMLLLFTTLLARGAAPAWLRETCQGLLSHLSLLFVPAGVGVLLHFQRLGAEWLPIAVALVASTVITIGVTALVMRALQR
ncbi:MAG: CidA/LrgA family protein [Betaproteobacteria bacterium]|nr:CidA/LrgA family protein [Betaproteobacteria bacterium]MDH5221458.1 CidA/LrgA family protein [Betaproteobacteria bacterium]MDH5351733.1 CidA/LrgA family protein [Betaproteobacteria bacterium]